MALTVQQVITRAVQRSALNNPDLVPMAQMIGYCSSYERAVYAMGAKYNPEFFGKDGDTAARTDNTEAWNIATTPGDVFALTAAVIKTITGTVTIPAGNLSVGDRVQLVSYRFPDLDIPPRAWLRNGKIVQIGDELGADGTNFVDDLTLFYSLMPTVVTTVSDSLTIPEEWADLVIVPLARLLALRDARVQEVQALDEEYNSLVAMFIDHVSVYDHGATRPLIAIPAATATRPPAGAPVEMGGPRGFNIAPRLPGGY